MFYELVIMLITDCIIQDLIYRVSQIKENRKRLIPIIECVILCGHEELPLRGHRDSGSIIVDGKFKINKMK